MYTRLASLLALILIFSEISVFSTYFFVPMIKHFNAINQNGFYFILLFYLLFIYFILFYYFTILYWFCHTSACIHTGVHVFPILNPPPTSLPIPSFWVIPVHQPQASILYQTWTGDSFLIWYCSCFNAILPNHPPTLSHRVQKTVLYICVSFAVSHIGLSLPSF